jgi:amidase
MVTRPHLSAKPIHPDCAAAVDFAAQVLAGLGHDVEDADPVGDAPGVAEDFLTVVAVELAAAAEETAALVGRKPRLGEIEPLSALTVMIGRQPSAVAFARARERLALLARRVTTFFDTYDVVLSPTLAAPPVAIGALRPHGLEAWAQKAVAALHLGFPLRTLRIPGVVRASAHRIFDFAAFTPLANVTGQPSMNVPLFWNEGGVPIGTMFTGRFSEEATLFRLAAELESACPWRNRRPPVRAGGGEAATATSPR